MELKNYRILRHLYFFGRGTANTKKLRKKAREKIDDVGLCFDSEAEKEKTVKDMLRMYRLYGYGFSEYLGYHFEKRSLRERRKFVADWEHFGYSDNSRMDLVHAIE